MDMAYIKNIPINCVNCGEKFLTDKYFVKTAKNCSVDCRKKYQRGVNSTNYKTGAYLPENKNEFNSWRAMKMRCYQKSYRRYDRYGGRGITVCDRWLGKDGFTNFLKDMGRKPTPKHTIDRIDNDGNYEPNNCRWANQREQIKNTRIIKYIEIGGVTKSLQEWLKDTGVASGTYYDRTRLQGMTERQALGL